MALRNGWPAVSGSPTQFDIRQDLRGLVFRDASWNVRSGIIPPVASPLVTPNSNMTVAIAPFSAVIDRGGPVLLCNDAAATSPTFGAAPSANSRIDLLWVKQQEAASPISDSTDGPIFGVTAGTASATPTAPSAPAGALTLYTAQIHAGASTMASSGVVLTPAYPHTCCAGGALWVRSSSELSAITPALGQDALDLSTGKRWRYLAGGWTVEDTGWKSTDGWTWGSGFSPAAASYNSMAPCEYRVTNFGQHVWIQGGVAHTNGNAAESPAFLLPASLRPSTHSPYRMFGPSITLRYDGTGNLDIAGIAVTTFTYIEIDWAI